MKKCKHCQTEIDSQAKICPNCRKKQGMSLWVIIAIILVVIVIISSLGGNESDNSEEKVKTTRNETLTLEEGYKGSLDEYGSFYYIEGYIKNNTDKEYDYVSVEFTTYDAEGNILGSCYDNNSGLEANGRWKFKASCLEDVENIASFKLKEITKW